jgi:cyclin T
MCKAVYRNAVMLRPPSQIRLLCAAAATPAMPAKHRPGARTGVEFPIPRTHWTLAQGALASTATAKAGMGQQELQRCVDETAEFMKGSRAPLKLPQKTIATAIVFFQRFLVSNALQQHDRHIIAYACVFLAAKVEDTPKYPMKSLEKVVTAMHRMRTARSSPAVPAPQNPSPPPDERLDSQRLYELREAVLKAERDILCALSFDLNLEHPYAFIQPYLAAIEGSLPAMHHGKAAGDISVDLRQYAWNFTNDSLRTTLCLQYLPQKVAAGCISLACEYMKFKPPLDLGAVYKQAQCTPGEVLDMKSQIFDMYERNQNQRATSCTPTGGGSSPAASSTASVSPASTAAPLPASARRHRPAGSPPTQATTHRGMKRPLAAVATGAAAASTGGKRPQHEKQLQPPPPQPQQQQRHQHPPAQPPRQTSHSSVGSLPVGSLVWGARQAEGGHRVYWPGAVARMHAVEDQQARKELVRHEAFKRQKDHALVRFFGVGFGWVHRQRLRRYVPGRGAPPHLDGQPPSSLAASLAQAVKQAEHAASRQRSERPAPSQPSSVGSGGSGGGTDRAVPRLSAPASAPARSPATSRATTAAATDARNHERPGGGRTNHGAAPQTVPSSKLRSLVGCEIDVYDELDEEWCRARVLEAVGKQFKVLYSGQTQPELCPLPRGSYRIVQKPQRPSVAPSSTAVAASAPKIKKVARVDLF